MRWAADLGRCSLRWIRNHDGRFHRRDLVQGRDDVPGQTLADLHFCDTMSATGSYLKAGLVLIMGLRTETVIYRTMCNAAFCTVVFLVASMRVAVSAPIEGESASEAQESDAPQIQSQPSTQLAPLLELLTDRQFSVRQDAIRELTNVGVEDVAEIGEAASTCRDAEVAGRLVQLLETLLISGDDAKSAAAAEALERAASSERWMVAESAAGVLDRNWERRILVSTRELSQLGVAFTPSDPSTLWGGDLNGIDNVPLGAIPFDRESLQINISKTWTGGERGIELLKRLGPLAGAQRIGGVRMIVYLIDGHPLKETEIDQIRGAFPEARVQARGRVCLGITNNIFVSDEQGCRVGEVRPGTSAHSAGIQENDLITHLEDMPVRDFDHLVESLRKYDVGDRVRMRVQRQNSALRNRLRFQIPIEDPRESDAKELEIEVELKGWN